MFSAIAERGGILMKSVTIRDKKGKVMVKVLQHKNGTYDTWVLTNILDTIDIEIRDEKNCKVY